MTYFNDSVRTKTEEFNANSTVIKFTTGEKLVIDNGNVKYQSNSDVIDVVEKTPSGTIIAKYIVFKENVLYIKSEAAVQVSTTKTTEPLGNL